MRTTEILAALEGAETGSRQLGHEVLFVFGWKITDKYARWPDGRLKRPYDFVTPDGKIVEYGHQPDPSMSIDDGFALLPARWVLGVTNLGAAWVEPKPGFRLSASLKTAPLSICHCLVRARRHRPKLTVAV